MKTDIKRRVTIALYFIVWFAFQVGVVYWLRHRNQQPFFTFDGVLGVVIAYGMLVAFFSYAYIYRKPEWLARLIIRRRLQHRKPNMQPFERKVERFIEGVRHWLKLDQQP